jgi:hypothetical protein
MKLVRFRLLFGLLVSGLLTACGGGGSNPPSTPLSVTTTSLSQGQTAVAYSATLSATGGTAPYSWSVKSGALPAGLSLSSGGAISGTPTTAGASSFVATVTDSKSAAADSGNLSIAISGGQLQITTTTAATGTVGTTYGFQLQAAGGVPPYSWAVTSGSSLPAGLSLSTAGVLSGTPTTAGTFNPSITVTDETGNNSTSQQVNFTINPKGTPLPDGGYAFQFNGTAHDRNPVAISGSFLVTQGQIGIGAYSENELNAQPVIVQSFTGGSVSIGSNGLGQLVLDLPSRNVTFALAVPASATTANNDTDIRMIEFDDNDESGLGSGVLKTSSVGSTAPANLKGGYAFGFRGYDTHSQPEAIVGSFQADGNGNITSGSVDVNDNGTVSNYSSVTGACTPGDLGGLITLKFGGNTLTYGYYQVSPTEFLATSTDQTSGTIPMVSGVVLQQQTGPFSNASFTGANVFQTTGSALQNAAYIPDDVLGVATSDGKGNVSATFDEFNGSLLATQKYTGTYSVDPATGRTPVTVSGQMIGIYYLVSNTRGFALGTDTSTSSGTVEAQTGSPFANASLKGSYLGGTIPWPDLHVVSLAVADGAGNVQFTSDGSSPNGLETDVTTSATYAVDATGRAPITVSGDSTPRIFYVVSPTKVVMLSGDLGGYLASFEQ